MLAVSTRVVLTLALGSACLHGQRLRVYSEFQRIMPDGTVLSVDRGASAREIISPAVPRNAWLTLRVAVEAPPGQPYYLYIGQNPEGAARYTIYREIYARSGDDWIADKLQKVEQPASATIAAGTKTQTYLLDVFVPPRTPAGRFRLEVQLNIGDHWIIYPLEIRVSEMAGSGRSDAYGWVPEPAARADAVVAGPLREYLCGAKSGGAAQPLDNIRAIALRNVLQDIAIAKGRAASETKEGVGQMLVKAAGFDSVENYCKSKDAPPKGAEWWMRARDYLYQGRPIH